jgi:hypothetical protein
VRVHLAGEHAAEFELLELFADAADLADHVAERRVVLLLDRELVQLRGLVERLADAVELVDDGFELGALAA